MKKHFMMVAAVLTGILIAFASCKDTKKHRSYDDDEDEDDTEQVDKKESKKQTALMKVARAEDLDDLDVDELDLSEFTMDDINFDDLDLDNLTSEQADNLLHIAAIVVSKELPQELDEGMQMTSMNIEDDDVVFSVDMKVSNMGITMDMFKAALGMAEVKKEMTDSMLDGLDDDMKAFMKVMVASHKNFVLRFIDSDSGDSADISLTSREISQMFAQQ